MPAPEKTASIINFSCLRTDTHLHAHACALVHSVPVGEQVAHLYNPTDCSNGTRGPNYILMASILLLASSREQEQNHPVSIFGGNSIIQLVETISRKHTWTSVGFAYCNKMKNCSWNCCFCLFVCFFFEEEENDHHRIWIEAEDIGRPRDSRDSCWSCHNGFKNW